MRSACFSARYACAFFTSAFASSGWSFSSAWSKGRALSDTRQLVSISYASFFCTTYSCVAASGLRPCSFSAFVFAISRLFFSAGVSAVADPYLPPLVSLPFLVLVFELAAKVRFSMFGIGARWSMAVTFFLTLVFAQPF